MAFFKEQKMKVNGMYYPVAVLVDRPVELDELAEQISEISTVSKADTAAVLAALAPVMSRGMNAGRSVHLEDIGYFRYTIDAKKGGRQKPEEVTAADIQATRVRFTPETKYNSGRTAITRTLTPDSVRWVKYGGKTVDDPADEAGGTTGGGTTGGGSTEDGDNPIG